MVKSVSGLTGSGVKDFIYQRLSAYFLLAYLIGLVVYLSLNGPVDFVLWKHLFSFLFMKIASLLMMVALILHAWIGMWTVFTDYIHCVWGRGILMLGTVSAFVVYLVWTVHILWS